jgi:uncharacterized protein
LELGGEYEIKAQRARVWELLNDPHVIKKCIPGCEGVSVVNDDQFSVTLVFKIGPLKPHFVIDIRYLEKNHLESFIIAGAGKGRVLGYAESKTKISLQDTPEGTLIKYGADAVLSGRIAQLGGRLIAGKMQNFTDKFFKKFSKIALAQRVAA